MSDSEIGVTVLIFHNLCQQYFQIAFQKFDLKNACMKKNLRS